MRPGRAQLRLGDTDPRIGGVARSLLAVEVGFGNEPAVHQRGAAVIFVLGQRRIGPRNLDRGGELRRGLRLDRAIDRRQHLALADPASGIDINCANQPAFARHSDWLVAASCQRAGCGHGLGDFASAGNNHRDRGDLPAATATRASDGCASGVGRRGAVIGAAEHGERDGQRNRSDHRSDDPPLFSVGPIDNDQPIRAFEAGFPVHTCHSFA